MKRFIVRWLMPEIERQQFRAMMRRAKDGYPRGSRGLVANQVGEQSREGSNPSPSVGGRGSGVALLGTDEAEVVERDE